MLDLKLPSKKMFNPVRMFPEPAQIVPYQKSLISSTFQQRGIETINESRCTKMHAWVEMCCRHSPFDQPLAKKFTHCFLIESNPLGFPERAAFRIGPMRLSPIYVVGARPSVCVHPAFDAMLLVILRLVF